MVKLTPRSPSHLRQRGRELWRAVAGQFELEDYGWTILRLAAEAADRAEEAREVLATSGLTISDRYGGVRSHPCVGIERDARLAVARLVRELGLDVEAPEARPPRVVVR
jgi:P27 family predicted phage terminase small subunit